jgi:hypothetical protein
VLDEDTPPSPAGSLVLRPDGPRRAYVAGSVVARRRAAFPDWAVTRTAADRQAGNGVGLADPEVDFRPLRPPESSAPREATP